LNTKFGTHEIGYRRERHASIDAMASNGNSETTIEELLISKEPNFEEAVRKLMAYGHASGLSLAQLEKRARMEKVLAAMREQDVSILIDYYIAKYTLKQIAAEAGVSPQAIHKRLKQAKKNFLVAFAENWNNLSKDDFLRELTDDVHR
jgi:RNA polymerase sigma factor (sigma-70 family)